MGDFVARSRNKVSWAFAVSVLVHAALFAVLLPGVSFVPPPSSPILVEFLIEPPDLDPEPEPASPEQKRERSTDQQDSPGSTLIDSPDTNPVSSAPTPSESREMDQSSVLPEPDSRLRPRQTTLDPRPISPPAPTRETQALRSILCLRLKGQERTAYKCDDAPSMISVPVTAVAAEAEKNASAQHSAELVQSNLKTSYVEQLIARNREIPSSMLDGIDNSIFGVSDGRDPNAKRIRNGQRPYWEDELRRDLERN